MTKQELEREWERDEILGQLNPEYKRLLMCSSIGDDYDVVLFDARREAEKHVHPLFFADFNNEFKFFDWRKVK